MHDVLARWNVNSTLLKTAIFDRCFFAFLSVPRTFELLFHGRNTLLNHVFLINDSVNICLFSKSGNSLIILFIYKNSELYQHSRDAGAALFSYMPLLYFRKEVFPPWAMSLPFSLCCSSPTAESLHPFMEKRDLEELEAGAYIVRWTSVLSNRFDSSAFKKSYADLYKSFTKQVASRRFSISV